MRRIEDAVIEYHLLLSTLYDLEERGESVCPLFRAGEPRWVGRVRECLAIPEFVERLFQVHHRSSFEQNILHLFISRIQVL